MMMMRLRLTAPVHQTSCQRYLPVTNTSLPHLRPAAACGSLLSVKSGRLMTAVMATSRKQQEDAVVDDAAVAAAPAAPAAGNNWSTLLKLVIIIVSKKLLPCAAPGSELLLDFLKDVIIDETKPYFDRVFPKWSGADWFDSLVKVLI